MKNKLEFRLLFFMCIFLGFTSLKAQNPNNIFYEDFESAVFPPNGWTTIQDTQELAYVHWYLFVDDKAALEGNKSAYIDTKVYNTGQDHQEPSKKEWLITPEISLPADQSAQLSFLWQASSIQALEKKTYSTWLLITTNDGASWDTLWCMTDPLTVVNSGIPFPWANWSRNNSEIDLTKYKGKKVKLAWFYHNFYFAQGDMFKLDRIKIMKYNPVLKPVANLNPTSFAFSNAYIGVTISSGNAFKLSNVGIDTLRITGIEGLEGSDFKCMISDFSKIELKKNDVLNFSVQYTPTLEGNKNATLTIKTNGGDVQLALSGTKITLPKDYVLESFEGPTFAPVGWTSSSWNRSQVASSGYYGASSTFSNKCLLTSPRLDLSGLSSPYISFDYIDYASDELYGSACDNVNTVEFSSDGGKTWKVLLTSKADEEGFWARKQINLSNETLTNNCFIRFQSKIDGEISYDLLFSQWYLDNIVLPPLYGSKLPPQASTNPFPANNAQNIYTTNLKMSWSEVLHATSYQVKIGNSQNQLGNILDTTLTTNSINISGLLNSTTYYWTVTPKNAAGSTTNPSIWQFTTIENIVINQFPYFQGFEDNTFPPLGWRTDLITPQGNKWGRSDIFPYEGKYSAYSGTQEGQTYMSMPAITLPADKEIQIAFMWGNDAPAGLLKTLSPAEHSDPKYYLADSGYFEVSTDQIKWKTMLTISETRRDSLFWRRAKVVLSEYAGKTVFLRWRYHCFNYAQSEGISLDNVIVEEYHKNGKAVFNLSEWNAGVVNNKQTVNSKNLLSVMNDGDATLVVKSVKFKHSNFSSNLQIGSSLAKSTIKPFVITFVANPVGDLTDTMTVEFENGLIAKFPVKGNALPINTRCYTFDEEEAFSTSLTDFTMIDADGKATVEPVLIYFPKRGTPLAYIAMNVRLADWRNVYPVSGEQCLSAFSAGDDSSPVEDWLISKKITATDNSKIRFYAKSYGNPEDFTLHKMTILVSETDANKTSFKAVKTAENMVIPHRTDSKFTEFTVDLGQYSGKGIHIALRQNADAKGFVMFLDDVWFEEFQFVATDNQAPQFTTTAPAGTNLNEVFTYNFKAIDPDGDSVKFSTVGLPSWLTITYNGKDGGTITGTPTIAGNVFFKIIATDGTASTTQEVLFSVNSSSNQAPSFTTTPPTEAQLGVEYVYEFKASDPENDAMQFSTVGDMPTWLNVTYNRTDGGTISGTPTQIGDIAFKIKVTDGQLNATQNVAFTIEGVHNEIEKEISFRCYPNPASSFINIETSENDFEVCIHNLSGIEIYRGKNIKSISLNNYPNGLYFVKFTSNNTVKITRIVKQ